MSTDQHNKIVSGIVFGILNFTPESHKGSNQHMNPEAMMQDLSMIVRDHYHHVIEILKSLMIDDL